MTRRLRLWDPLGEPSARALSEATRLSSSLGLPVAAARADRLWPDAGTRDAGSPVSRQPDTAEERHGKSAANGARTSCNATGTAQAPATPAVN